MRVTIGVAKRRVNMPDYKRLVSYMYTYEEGKKRNNVGYSKVESKNGQCKFTIHASALSYGDRSISIYGFKRVNNKAEGIELGSGNFKNGVLEFRMVTEASNISQSGYSIDDIAGIILYHTDSKYLATSWEEEPITYEQVIDITSKRKSQDLKRSNHSDNIIEYNSREAAKPLVMEEKPVVEREVQSVVKDIEKPRDIQFQRETQADKKEETISRDEIADKLDKLPVIQDIEETEIIARYMDETEEVAIKSENNISQLVDTITDNIVSNYEQDRGYLQSASILNQEHSDRHNNACHDYICPRCGHRRNMNKNRVRQNSPEGTNINRSQQNRGNSRGHNGGHNGGLGGERYNGSQGHKSSNGVSANPNDRATQSVNFNVEEEPQAVKKLLLEFTRMYPFEDLDVVWCVKIEPKDIGILPSEIWPLANNSFLLHGFYGYKHLIFGKIKNHNGVTYMLGIPGIYHNRERFMAKMYGFEEFKGEKNGECKDGDFGYWYTKVRI